MNATTTFYNIAPGVWLCKCNYPISMIVTFPSMTVPFKLTSWSSLPKTSNAQRNYSPAAAAISFVTDGY